MPYQEAARELLRQTVFDAAREQLASQTWSEITMADIASGAGVSRQTLYNEFGNRNEFGFAFVIHEAERFMDDVEKAVLQHTDDPRAAVLAALEHFLRTAGEDPLISILLSDDGTGGMLPFVTTQGLPVVQWATARLTSVIEDGWPEAPEGDVKLLAEALVRLAISYVTTPGESAEEAARAASQLLGPFIDKALGAASS
jgi:AcrR family transcriptional regulator